MNNRVHKYLLKKPQTSIDNLYKYFDIKSQKSKERILKILKDLEAQKIIVYDKKNQRIYVESLKSRQSTKSVHDTRPALRFAEASQDVSTIVERYSLPERFPRQALKEIQDKVWLETPHHDTRKDLRDVFVITIDGADSKDLDDAVSISKSLFGKWTLGVHIADVSYYVSKNSSLDKEAFERSNSYYLIDTVIPMLPKELSNDLCSLNPDEDKKTMSIFMDFDSQGTMLDYRITTSVIRSNYRMTYDRVEEIIKGAKEKDSKLLKNIKMMDKLFRILNKKRMNNGSVEFNFKERKIKLDSNGEPTQVYQKDRLDSERLIEEFMLAANQAAGDFLTQKGLGLYRIHDVPPAEKYQNLRQFAAKRGSVLPEIPKPQDIQHFVKSLENTPMQISGEILALRSMAQASYHRENIGHFGLGFDMYSHFTSPIRRYADLVVHRLIKHFLYNAEAQNPYTEGSLDKIGQYISAQERVALEAERDLAKIKCVRFMKSHVGETFKGKVSSVATFGLFIEMEQTGIEALIRYADMNDYMIFDQEELTARNKNGSKIYKLGTPVSILLTNVNTERGFIDAMIVDDK